MKIQNTLAAILIVCSILLLCSIYIPRPLIQNFTSESDKVSVTLMSGFGNRIFQILAGLQYAEQNNKEFVIVKQDMSESPHEAGVNDTIFKMFPGIRVLDTLEYQKRFDYSASAFEYIKIPYSDGNVLLSGYFQSEKYFPSTTPNIRTDSYPTTYFIHIRAGDYINNSNHYVELDNYYRTAIRIIRESQPDATFLVFSNDNEYAVEKIRKYDIQYIISNTKSAYDTVVQMANCKGGICANSSLSWLGGYFQKEARGIVCMPSKWIHSGQSIADLYPPWATIIDV